MIYGSDSYILIYRIGKRIREIEDCVDREDWLGVEAAADCITYDASILEERCVASSEGEVVSEDE